MIKSIKILNYNNKLNKKHKKIQKKWKKLTHKIIKQK